MTTVYIDRKGIQPDHEPGVAVLRAGGERLDTVPLAAVERLVLRGIATVSTRLLAKLWARRVSLVVLGGRRSEIVAMMHGPTHPDADIRLCQYALHGDEAPLHRAVPGRWRHLQSCDQPIPLTIPLTTQHPAVTLPNHYSTHRIQSPVDFVNGLRYFSSAEFQ